MVGWGEGQRELAHGSHIVPCPSLPTCQEPNRALHVPPMSGQCVDRISAPWHAWSALTALQFERSPVPGSGVAEVATRLKLDPG